jgi:hypothetical protein
MFCAVQLGDAGVTPRRLTGRLSIHRHQERHPNQRLGRPSQVILTVPDKGRVTAVAIGGKDTLYAFFMKKIWKREIQQALGAWSPWTKVVPNNL